MMPMPQGKVRLTEAQWRWRKPTAKVFFICWGLVWIATLIAVSWYAARDGAPLPVIFLMLSAINICFATVNIVGTIIGMAFDWWPWRDDD